MVILQDRVAMLSFGSESLILSYNNLSYNGWNYVLIKPTEAGIVIYLDGVETNITSQYFNDNRIFTNGSIFRVGYTDAASPYNFIGNVTPLYSGLQTSFIDKFYYYVMNNNFIQRVYTSSINSSLRVHMSDIKGDTNLTLNGKNFYFKNKLKQLEFGKLSPGTWGLNISISSISLLTYKSNRYFVVPLFYFAFLPYMLLPVFATYIRKIDSF